MTNTNYIVKIGGSAVNAIAGTLDVQNQIGQRSTGGLQTWSAAGVTYNYGTQVQVLDLSNNVVFSGYTSKDEITKSSRLGHGYMEHRITLMDSCYLADKRVFFGSFLNATAGSIVQALLSQVLAAEGVTSTASSIAVGPLIQQVIWEGKQISAALQWLAQQAGYWWNIDSNKVLWFQPYSGTSAPFVLDGTTVSSDSNLKVTYGNSMYVNRQYVRGAFAQTGSLTETFVGNSNTRSFTLSYPVSTITSVTLDGVSLTVSGGSPQVTTKGSTGAVFYYAAGDAVIAHDPAFPVLTGGDTLVVTYKGRYPILALAQNQGLEITQKAREGGGTGWVESVYHNAKITEAPAAFQIAGGMLARYASDMTQLEFDVLASKASGLAEGQMLTVNLSDFGLTNAQMLVTMVEITDSIDGFNIYYHVLAVGSPYDAAQWQSFYQNLLNQATDNADLSDTADTNELAFVLSSSVSISPTITTHLTKTTCLLCGNATLCGPSQLVC